MTTAKSKKYVFKNTSDKPVKIGDSLFSITVPAGMEKEMPEKLIPAAQVLEAQMVKSAPKKKATPKSKSAE